MNKKTVLSILSLTFIGVMTSCIVFKIGNNESYETKGSEKLYSLNLDADNNFPTLGNKFISTSGMAFTSTKNTLIIIDYNKAKNLDGYLLSLDQEGSILNPYKNEVYDQYNNAISGIKNITINFDGVKSLDLYYGWESELKDNRYANFLGIESGVTYDLDNRGPSYFKIYNNALSTANIKSVLINYSCSITTNTESYSRGLDFDEIIYNNQPAAILRKYHGEEESVIMPDTYLGLPVKVIGARAFSDNPYIKTVGLPLDIEKIEESAFINCSNLASVSFPEDLNIIEDCAFKGCHNLKEPHFPKTLTTIGANAFENCYALENIFIGKHIKTIGHQAFIQNREDNRFFFTDASSKLSGWSETFIANLNRMNYNASNYIYSKDLLDYMIVNTSSGRSAKLFRHHISRRSHKDLIIPSTIPFDGNNISVNEIAPYAFSSESEAIRHVTLPKSIKILGDAAFSYSGLESINLEHVEYIGSYCFNECRTLNNLYIGENCTYVGDNAFSGSGSTIKDGNVIYIYFKNRPATWNKHWNEYDDFETIFWGFRGFYEDEKYSYTIVNDGTDETPNIVAYITKYKGSDENLIIPATIRYENKDVRIISIERGAFKNAYSLTSISFQSGGVTSLGKEAFYNCSSLTSINLDGIKRLGESSFESNTSLKELYISDSVEYIGQYAINNCSKLTKITGMKGLKEILEAGISSNANLVSLSIPRGLKKLHRCAFYSNPILKDLYLPNTITYLGSQICGGCNRNILTIHFEPGYDPFKYNVDAEDEWNLDRRDTYFTYKNDYIL